MKKEQSTDYTIPFIEYLLEYILKKNRSEGTWGEWYLLDMTEPIVLKNLQQQ